MTVSVDSTGAGPHRSSQAPPPPAQMEAVRTSPLTVSVSKIAAKVITGKVGDRLRAFVHLCRLAEIDARLGLVHDRLDPPAVGPISRAASFHRPAVRIGTRAGARWLRSRDR